MKKTALIVLSAAILAIAVALMQDTRRLTSGLFFDRTADSSDVSRQLMQHGLQDMTLGVIDAPNTIVEYASMTCVHCARFHKDVFPRLMEHIEEGKVRYVFRDFPLDATATVVAMLLRCTEKENFFPLLAALFETQEAWASAQEQQAGIRLFHLFNAEGMSREQFNKCLADKALFDKLGQARAEASKQFDVNSTPTLFVNGQKLKNPMDIEEIEALFVLGPKHVNR